MKFDSLKVKQAVELKIHIAAIYLLFYIMPELIFYNELRKMKDLNYKLDRTACQALTFAEADIQIKKSTSFSTEERFDHFNYLMSIAYRFAGEAWPRMDKTAFEKISRDNGLPL